MASPDGACVGIDVQTERGKTAYNGRIFEVTDARHARMLREQGAFPANLGGTPRVSGFTCGGCGFVAFFTTCSRCGGSCTRDVEQAEPVHVSGV